MLQYNVRNPFDRIAIDVSGPIHGAVFDCGESADYQLLLPLRSTAGAK
jgi:hypothetical protein